MCWKFFKYKLVVDDISHKLDRDCKFMDVLFSSGRSEDPLENADIGQVSQTPDSFHATGTEASTAEHTLELPEHPVYQTPSPSGSSAPNMSQSNGGSNAIETHKKWKVPCCLKETHKIACVLSAEINYLSAPLEQITQMVPFSLCESLLSLGI